MPTMVLPPTTTEIPNMVNGTLAGTLSPHETVFSSTKETIIDQVPSCANGNGVDFTFDNMSDALQAFQRGEFLLVMDDEGRENEGDLIIAASKITTEKMAWFIKVTR